MLVHARRSRRAVTLALSFAALVLLTAAACRAGVSARGPAVCAPSPASSGVFPLSASPDGRYLEDASGAPFFMVGDAAQSAAGALSQAQWECYLDDRISRGFNTVNVNFMEHHYSPSPPADTDGNMPFTTRIGGGTYAGTSQMPDFGFPNDAYWAGLEQRVAYAQSKGVLVSLAFYMGNANGNHVEGWYNELAANSLAAATSFGTYLANGHGAFGGFKQYANVMWVWGADWLFVSDTDTRDKLRAIPAAIRAAGASHLMSGDWGRGIATRQSGFQTYMDLEADYDYRPDIATSARAGFSYVPSSASGDGRALSALPVFQKETEYEGESTPSGTPPSVRSSGWQSILNGCTTGYWFGNSVIWNFGANGGDWISALDSTGAQDMSRLSALMRSLEWWKLVPSGTSVPFIRRKLVPSGETSDESGTISAAQASDGSLMLVYVPSSGTTKQTLTVDLRSMATSSRARWWDPTTGAFTPIGGFANDASGQTFTTPGLNGEGANDWLLVLDSVGVNNAATPRAPAESSASRRSRWRADAPPRRAMVRQ